MGPNQPEILPDLSFAEELLDRYNTEIVEAMSLCPYARTSRELGRTPRLVYRLTDEEHPDAEKIAVDFSKLILDHPEIEVGFLAFCVRTSHPWWSAPEFDQFVKQVRGAYEVLPAETFYMVAFHPEPRTPDPAKIAPNPHSFVAQLRRTPYPVIQCVRAQLLNDVRAQAQKRAQRKVKDQFGEAAILADSDLSKSIAQQNFDHWGSGAARDDLERRIGALHRARRQKHGIDGQ